MKDRLETWPVIQVMVLSGICSLIAAGIFAANIFMAPQSKPVFSGKIDGRQVYYSTSNRSWFGVRHSPNKLTVYDSQRLAQIFEDCNLDGTIGDAECDSYTVFPDNDKKIVYSRDFVLDSSGIRHSIDGGELERKVVEGAVRPKLEEANAQYKTMLAKIEENLKSELR